MLSQKTLLTCLPFVLLLAACSKSGSDNPTTPENRCTAVTSLKATPSATVQEKGQPLSFSASIASGLTYSWKTPAGATLTTATGGVQSVDFADEGWYYLEGKNTCNETKKDSFYVDVTVPQGAAGCTPADNSINYTAAGHQPDVFTTVKQGENTSVPDVYEMRVTGSRNEYTLTFHPSYKNNKQPESGVYTTGTWSSTGYPAFGAKDYDKVYFAGITYSPATILYRSTPGQKIYVTRVAGKMKITACNLALTGSSGGVAYSTNTTLSATEQ